MNYKEQILEKFKKKTLEKTGMSAESLGGKTQMAFCYHDIEELLNFLPSEEEIAKRMYNKWLQYILDEGRGSHLAISWNTDPAKETDFEGFEYWLSTREEGK